MPDPAKNKELVRQVIEQIYNQGNLQMIDQLISPQHTGFDVGDPFYQSHEPTYQHNTDGIKQFVFIVHTLVPDIHYTIDDIMAEGDNVLLRWTARGTLTGNAASISGTGQPVEVMGMSRITVGSDGTCNRLETFSNLQEVAGQLGLS